MIGELGSVSSGPRHGRTGLSGAGKQHFRFVKQLRLQQALLAAVLCRAVRVRISFCAPRRPYGCTIFTHEAQGIKSKAFKGGCS